MARARTAKGKKTPFMTIEEAARYTGLSAYFLRCGCKDGTIPHVKCGNTYMINVLALMKQYS